MEVHQVSMAAAVLHRFVSSGDLNTHGKANTFTGMDLTGNTFWEFRERLNASRPRRIMAYKGGHTFQNYQNFKIDRMLLFPQTLPMISFQRASVHLNTDSRIIAQWHQWLRNTRDDPPTLPELESEVQRQVQMVQRAKIADARWANKPSLLQQPQGKGTHTTGQLEQQLQIEQAKRRRMTVGEGEGAGKDAGKDYQPQEWTPGPAPVKRMTVGEGQGTGSDAGKDYQPQEWTPGPAKR